MYPEVRDLRDKVRVLVKQHHHMLRAIYGGGVNIQQHSIRRGTAPWATGLATMMEGALTAISGILFVYSLLSVLWLSRLRGVRSCGGLRGLGSCLGLTRLLVFSILLSAFLVIKK